MTMRTVKMTIGLFVTMAVMATAGWCEPRVAVVDFENKSSYGDSDLGRGAADILTTELVKVGKFDMYEREQLDSVLSEQDLGATDRIDPATAAQIGKVIGINYIITGAVTEYGNSESSGGGGGVNVGKKGYRSTVDVRMVDANTGKIVFAESGSGARSSVNVNVFGYGGGEDFNEKLATEAMREAISEVAGKIARLQLNTPPAAVAKMLVADVDENTVTLNRGKNGGLKEGQTLTVRRPGKEIKDPDTGKVLKVKYTTVGTIRLTAVEAGIAEGTVVSGSGFQVGDMAE